MLWRLFAQRSLLRSFASRKQLVANPNKLQKNVALRKSVAFLHKDVRIRRSTVLSPLTDMLLAQFARTAVRNFTAKDDGLDFYFAYTEKFGIESFRHFVERHEVRFQKCGNPKFLEDYLKACWKAFEGDKNLMDLFVSCNFRKLKMDAIPKFIAEDEAEAREKEELRFSKFHIQMPSMVPLFDNYQEIQNTFESHEDSFNLEFIQNDSDIPQLEQFPDCADIELKQERSLAEFLKRQEINTRRVLDKVLRFKETPFSYRREPSKFVYMQMEFGDDSYLTKPLVMKSLKLAGIKNVVDVHIMNPLVGRSDDEPDIDDYLSLTTQGPVSEQRVAELAESSSNSLMLATPALKDEELTGVSSTSSEVEKDTQRFKGIVKFATSAPRRNAAYGFVEFEDVESKSQLVRTNFRLFGIEVGKGLLTTEDADLKCTLRITNLPWNLSPTHFANFLNEECRNAGLHSNFKCPERLRGFVSDASYLYLEMDNFESAYRLRCHLNTKRYKDRPLAVDFKHGSSRFIEGKFTENFSTVLLELKEKIHIQTRTLEKVRAQEEALINE